MTLDMEALNSVAFNALSPLRVWSHPVEDFESHSWQGRGRGPSNNNLLAMVQKTSGHCLHCMVWPWTLWWDYTGLDRSERSSWCPHGGTPAISAMNINWAFYFFWDSPRSQYSCSIWTYTPTHSTRTPHSRTPLVSKPRQHNYTRHVRSLDNSRVLGPLWQWAHYTTSYRSRESNPSGNEFRLYLTNNINWAWCACKGKL